VYLGTCARDLPVWGRDAGAVSHVGVCHCAPAVDRVLVLVGVCRYPHSTCFVDLYSVQCRCTNFLRLSWGMGGAQTAPLLTLQDQEVLAYTQEPRSGQVRRAPVNTL
jgi:hypothetical protein